MAGAKKASTKGSAKRTKKPSYYPVVRSYPVTSGPVANTLVDHAQIMSQINRRLVRFGRYHEVKVDLRPDYVGTVEVFALRNDWAVQKAYQMAYQSYLKATADERAAMSDKQVARWEDFRVEHGLTLPINSTPTAVFHQISGAAVTVGGGEHAYSTVTDSANVNRTFTWGTPSATQYGILQEYDKYADTDSSPSNLTVGTVVPYSDLEDDIDGAQAERLERDGDAPPYEPNGVNASGPWVRIGVLGAGAAGQQRLSTGYFTAPCGLILLKGYSETSEAYSISIEAKAGDYKGVHAPSMLE
jgi:hypothetical protein